jgi:tetratricopeptide (TPR) repeat protein
MLAANAMALDVNALWDHSQPALSEQRFVAALGSATADEKLILQTQIARTHGMRRDFAKAREILAAVEPQLAGASPEARVRYHLELGRTQVSPAHPPDAITPSSREVARGNYLKAYELAAQARLDLLAIDALHMMVVVDTEPEQQLAWNQKALDHLVKSDQPEAKGWEGSLRNNVGYALHLKGDHDAALAQFQLSRAAHERAGKVRNVRIADWMIAWTWRAQKQYDKALALQLELERAWQADGQPDPYVFEELEQLYRALGDEGRAQAYAAKLKAASK